MKNIYSLLQKLFILTLIFIGLGLFVPVHARDISKSTTVSVSLGSYRFRLFGYTSPQGSVTINGLGVSDTTSANQQGYFEFENTYSPLAPRELCLTSQDQFGRLTMPTCLPPFPVKSDITIGPVVMPPTVSLDKKDYFIGDEVILSGQSIPGKEITMSVFTEDKQGLIKGVEAFTFPKIQAKTDAKGNFSFALSSAASKKYRLFTQVNYDEHASPKSLMLNLEILPIWMIIIKILGLLWKMLMSRLLDILLIGQVLILVIYLINYFFHPFRLFKTRALALRTNNYALTIQEHSLTLIK